MIRKFLSRLSMGTDQKITKRNRFQGSRKSMRFETLEERRMLSADADIVFLLVTAGVVAQGALALGAGLPTSPKPPTAGLQASDNRLVILGVCRVGTAHQNRVNASTAGQAKGSIARFFRIA